MLKKGIDWPRGFHYYYVCTCLILWCAAIVCMDQDEVPMRDMFGEIPAPDHLDLDDNDAEITDGYMYALLPEIQSEFGPNCPTGYSDHLYGFSCSRDVPFALLTNSTDSSTDLSSEDVSLSPIAFFVPRAVQAIIFNRYAKKPRDDFPEACINERCVLFFDDEGECIAMHDYPHGTPEDLIISDFAIAVGKIDCSTIWKVEEKQRCKDLSGHSGSVVTKKVLIVSAKVPPYTQLGSYRVERFLTPREGSTYDLSNSRRKQLCSHLHRNLKSKSNHECLGHSPAP